MKKYVVGIFNGVDVDDYYIDAESEDMAIDMAVSMSGGTVFTVLEIG